MFVRKLIASAAALFALLSSGACGDTVLPQAAEGVAAITAKDTVRGWQHAVPGRTTFPCTYETGGGNGALRSGQGATTFPKSELDPDGSSRLYVYHGYSGNQLVFVAWCAIPATDAAVRHMDRKFKVQRPQRDLGLTVDENCVRTKQGCILAPVSVTACVGGASYPACGTGTSQPEDDDYCSDFGICAGGGGGAYGGGGGGGENGNGTPGAPCNTGDPMVDSPGVWGQFDRLWKQSIAAGIEQGGWIIRNPDGSHTLVPFQNATFTACGIDVFEAVPAGAVSTFHTHPWPLGSVTPCGSINTGTPSSDDVRGLQTLGFDRGFIADGGGIGVYTPTGGESASRKGRCGY